MKIGTLTLHLPFNYGNALQMLSLNRYLVEQGYDAEVISRWDLPNRNEIMRVHHEIRTLRGIIKVALRCVLWCGEFCCYQREHKIVKWLGEKIKWSAVEGYGDHFDTQALPYDMVIVGSDQVWNLKYQAIRFFFLKTFPDRIKKISYAASMGGNILSDENRAFLGDALERFSAISVRELSAKKIIEEEGFDATLVCDPTLLHTKEEWQKILGVRERSSDDEDAPYMVYLVSPSAGDMWRDLIRLAKEGHRRVHAYAFWAALAPIERGRRIRCMAWNIYRRLRLYFSGVRLHFSATPTEFVQRVAECGGLFTDSFHGMMFATIFEKKCNVMIGSDPERVQMAARLVDFCNEFGNADILTPTLEVGGLRRLGMTPTLERLIADSKAWLKNAIERG